MFKLGELYITNGIDNYMKQGFEHQKEIITAFSRYKCMDWSDTCDSDKALNDSAVKNNDDRILAKYLLSDGKEIFIITEYDRSATTILFCSEY